MGISVMLLIVIQILRIPHYLLIIICNVFTLYHLLIKICNVLSIALSEAILSIIYLKLPNLMC